MDWIVSFLTPRGRRGGLMVSALVSGEERRAVRVRALAGDIVLCSWARHFTLAVPLSTQVNKWLPVFIAQVIVGPSKQLKQISQRHC